MKKIFGIGLLLTCLFSVVSCKKNKNVETKNAVEALKERGTFVLGLDDSFPPLGYRDKNNEIIGYDIDLAKEVAKRLGVNFKAQPIDWDAKEMELETGKIDCIWNGFTITEERKNALSFTKAYLNNEQVLVVRADSGIKTLADMKGKTVIGGRKGVRHNKDNKIKNKAILELLENVAAYHSDYVRTWSK